MARTHISICRSFVLPAYGHRAICRNQTDVSVDVDTAFFGDLAPHLAFFSQAGLVLACSHATTNSLRERIIFTVTNGLC